MAELYVSGQIESADGFGDNRVCCRWSLMTGGGWRVVEGAVEGQTQTDLPSVFEEAYFAHPVDLHLATKTIQGWPRMQLQVWHHDIYGRQELLGYGSLFLPSTPGEHEAEYIRYPRVINPIYESATMRGKGRHPWLICNIWRPKGTAREEMMQRFIGGGIQVSSLSVLEDATERMGISTVAMGRVRLRLYVITRHFEQFGILS